MFKIDFAQFKFFKTLTVSSYLVLYKLTVNTNNQKNCMK